MLWPVIMLPDVITGTLAQLVAYMLRGKVVQSLPDHTNSFGSALLSIIVAPIVETLLLCLWIETATHFKLKKIRIAVIAGVVAGLFHAIFSPTWFFTTAWGFFVFTCAYLAWRPTSFPKAFTAAAVPHALNNATVVLLLFFIS